MWWGVAAGQKVTAMTLMVRWWRGDGHAGPAPPYKIVFPPTEVICIQMFNFINLGFLFIQENVPKKIQRYSLWAALLPHPISVCSLCPHLAQVFLLYFIFFVSVWFPLPMKTLYDLFRSLYLFYHLFLMWKSQSGPVCDAASRCVAAARLRPAREAALFNYCSKNK